MKAVELEKKLESVEATLQSFIDSSANGVIKHWILSLC